MSDAGQRFSVDYRVYYEDTDAGGVVYYANYLRFLERARTDWLREWGFDQAAIAREHGVLFAVRSVDIRYRQPARLDEQLTVSLQAKVCGHLRIDFDQDIRIEQRLIATAQVGVVSVDAESFRPRSIPEPLMQTLSTQALCYD